MDSFNKNENFYDFYFLLRNMGMDYESYKKLSPERRKEIIQSIKREHITEFRAEKIHKIFGN